MQALICSDLHTEFGDVMDVHVPDTADVLICAGDVAAKGIVPSIVWLAENLPRSLPIVFVAGNHEYWGSSVEDSIRDACEAVAKYPNIHFLENEAVELDGVLFVGGTLWTDFSLLSPDPMLRMRFAQYALKDFRKIKWSKIPYRRFQAIHAFRKHFETRQFIEAILRNNDHMTKVVVTHHAPSAKSLAPEDLHDPQADCWASDLEALIKARKPTVWVHGHVHRRNDYTIADTRVISNPRGYPGEKTGFDKTFLVEL
ncbi:metallophosphoesterase [Rhizobium leguminosarum]|uniref:metallophosphoesterase n=1 Tax=Rhizobium leguminosarum TaxID=384 RepID=UPI003F97AC22